MPPNNQPINNAQVPQSDGNNQSMGQFMHSNPQQNEVQQNSKKTNDKLKPKNEYSSQNTLLLSEIRENMVIMTDGSFRSVVVCQPINFDLMSPAEREAVEYSYQNFLNSLNYPIQILIRSQRVDIGPYIEKLIDVRNSSDNMLLNVLMDDYIYFIDVLSQEANIMNKAFFIVVPYFPEGELNTPLDQGKSLFKTIFGKKSPEVIKIDNVTYDRAQTELKNRIDAVMSGLFQIGIKSVQLNTKELGELYYNFYNPDTAIREPLGNFNETASTYIRKEPTNPQGGGNV